MNKVVGSATPKVDTKQLVMGGAVYVDDYPRLPGTMHLKIVGSPYSHAYIESVDVSRAMKLEGVVTVLTYEDSPNKRYSNCGGSYPDSSPFDRIVLDREMRFIGDTAAVVCAESVEIAEKAASLVKISYKILPSVYDTKEAFKGEVLVHGEDDNIVPAKPKGYDLSHNKISEYLINIGDVDKALEESEYVHSAMYHVQAQAHAMMETLRSYTYLAPDGRLTVIATTQNPYHMRRQLSTALDYPIGNIHVIKMRVGGGFGGKKLMVCDGLAALATLKTGRPASLVLGRRENFRQTSTRHEMDMRVSVAADKDGNMTALKVENMSNTGAYGEEGPAVTMVTANNILPSYNQIPSIYYKGETIYTNRVPGGALRGYGATQGGFAIEAAVSELAHKMGINTYDIRVKNMAKLGDVGGVLHSEIKSCGLDKCMAIGKEKIGWDEKYPRTVISDHKIRSVGCALTSHRTSIPGADKGTVTIRLERDGSYMLLTGAADLGTGADTVLVQIAAETLKTTPDKIHILSGDTDSNTYDSGAFASSTTYVAGNAVKKTAETLVGKILAMGAMMLESDVAAVEFDGSKVFVTEDPEKSVSITAIGSKSEGGLTEQVIATETYASRLAPLTFMSGFAEIELDTDTGEIEIIKFVSVADAGTVINPNLAKIQAESGILMGLGYALYEEADFTEKGKLIQNNFMQYKIPCREDLPADFMDVSFVETYEPSGPYGAKSIGEASLHVVAPAIADALMNAAGIAMHSLPMTPEKVWAALQETKVK